jgi:hypothetical protein
VQGYLNALFNPSPLSVICSLSHLHILASSPIISFPVSPMLRFRCFEPLGPLLPGVNAVILCSTLFLLVRMSKSMTPHRWQLSLPYPTCGCHGILPQFMLSACAYPSCDCTLKESRTTTNGKPSYTTVAGGICFPLFWGATVPFFILHHTSKSSYVDLKKIRFGQSYHGDFEVAKSLAYHR